MKRILALCVLLLPGCYSYFPLREEEQLDGRPRVDEDIVIVLTDSTEIVSPAGRHVMLHEPSNLFAGVGQGMKKYTKIVYPFSGILRHESLDSSAIISADGAEYLKCWLADSTVITFKNGEYIVATTDLGAGFYCSGEMRRKWNLPAQAFEGMIPPEKIRHVEVQKIDGVGTGVVTALLLSATGGVLLYLALSTIRIDCPWFEYH